MAQRSRNATRSRAAIIDAATDEFANRGIEGARMDAIALRAGCDKRLIYHYFGGKKDLYKEVIQSDLAKLDQAIDGLDHDTDPETRIRHFVERYIDFLTDQPAHARLTIQQELVRAAIGRPAGRKVRSRIFDFLAESITHGQRAGTFRDDLEPGRAVLSVWAACMHPFTLRDTLADFAGPTADPQAERAQQKEHATAFILGALRG